MPFELTAQGREVPPESVKADVYHLLSACSDVAVPYHNRTYRKRTELAACMHEWTGDVNTLFRFRGQRAKVLDFSWHGLTTHIAQYA